jgi:hypothetical protein
MTKKDLAIAAGVVSVGAALTNSRRLAKEHQLLLIAGGLIAILRAL